MAGHAPCAGGAAGPQPRPGAGRPGLQHAGGAGQGAGGRALGFVGLAPGHSGGRRGGTGRRRRCGCGHRAVVPQPVAVRLHGQRRLQLAGGPIGRGFHLGHRGIAHSAHLPWRCLVGRASRGQGTLRGVGTAIQANRADRIPGRGRYLGAAGRRRASAGLGRGLAPRGRAVLPQHGQPRTPGRAGALYRVRGGRTLCGGAAA
ncbi:hypothetical protein D3C87_1486020 [compost metagenome]